MGSAQETAQVDVVIIGAGVVGAAVAAQISRQKPGLSIMVLERGPRPGEGITSRNSGVIHSGLYYEPGSLKARLCIRGQELLYAWCEAHAVPYRRIGKLVVARKPEQKAGLHAIYQNALDSGATGLEIVGADRIREIDPHVEGLEALWVPKTGIIDPYELTRSLLHSAEQNGAVVVYHTQVREIEWGSPSSRAARILTHRGVIEAQCVINCAGLYSDELARQALGENAPADLPRIYPCRGDYFELISPYEFRTLVYPVKDPSSPGLGIHLTLDLAGKIRLGPDTEYVSSKEDFSSRPEKKQRFLDAVSISLGLHPPFEVRYDTCGIRPKIRSPQAPHELDFYIRRDHPQLINLIGIESPGLTASLAIGEYVVGWV